MQEAGVTVTVNDGDSNSGHGNNGGTSATAGALAGSSNSSYDPLSAKLLGARLSHGEALTIRLGFIRFAVSHSPLELTFEHLERLWVDFLGNPLCGEYEKAREKIRRVLICCTLPPPPPEAEEHRYAGKC